MEIDKLRIGSWIEYKGVNERTEKKEWIKDQIAAFDANDKITTKKGIQLSSKEIRIIKLHDWVFLSSKQILQNPEVFTILSQTPPNDISYYAGEGTIHFKENKSNNWIAKYITDEGKKQTTLRYVHELQNLYFLLTEEELEIEI